MPQRSESKEYSKCSQLIEEGKYKEALALAESIAIPALRAAILIDAGFALNKSGKVREGTEIFESLLSIEQSDLPFTKSSVLYNAANGRSSLYTLRRKRRTITFPTDDDDLRKAKSHYRDALSALDEKVGPFASQVLVNFGNCLSQFGRFAEAIECYERALKAEPSNGMAAGNLGIELDRAALLTFRYRHEYATLAHDLLSRALGPNMHLDYGTAAASQEFRLRLERLQDFMNVHSEPILLPIPPEVATESKVLEEYTRFCIANGLFLNLWVGDKKLSPGVTDDISFHSIVTSLDDDYLVPELCRILNEIKESYAAARFIYFLSQGADVILDRISAMTVYHDMHDYTINGLYTGLCKTAYSRAFDVLDKVARIINVYFHIGQRRAPFWDVLAEKQSLGEEHTIRYAARPAVRKTGNPGLFALADLCVDYFESEHVDFKIIDERRNKVTHDYLSVKLYPRAEEPDAGNTIGLYDLQAQTSQVLRLARYAILYAVSAINIAESKNAADAGRTVTLPVLSTPGQPFL